MLETAKNGQLTRNMRLWKGSEAGEAHQSAYWRVTALIEAQSSEIKFGLSANSKFRAIIIL